jgi:hypothetical protein
MAVQRRRSQAQEDSVRKAGRISGERRRAARKRREDTELREAQERVGRAVEVTSMRRGAPYLPGKFYVIHDDSRDPLLSMVSFGGAFDTAQEAADERDRNPGTCVAREASR